MWSDKRSPSLNALNWPRTFLIAVNIRQLVMLSKHIL